MDCAGGANADAERLVVVVTGGSQGIGAAVAREFARRGNCYLALLARREGPLREVAAECRKFPRVDAEGFPCDVTDEGAVGRTIEAVAKKAGRIDVLVNNAGEFVPGSFLEYSLADFDQQVAVNLRSVFLVSQAVARGMAERGRGDIVNIGSIAGLQAHPGGTGYCAAKAGLHGLTRVMREELKGHGIRVTAVIPGATWTPSWEGSGVDPKTLMPAEDVARAVVEATRLSRGSVIEEIVLRPLQ